MKQLWWMAAFTVKRQRYETGAEIPFSGIYMAFHSFHRLPQVIMLMSGDKFPRCAKCDWRVTFTLLRKAKPGFIYQPVHLYELPVLEDEEKKAD